MNSLPSELLIPIVHYVYQLRTSEAPSDIRSLMLASKRFYAIAKPYLYRHLEPEHISIELGQTLLDRHVASYVQRFDLLVDSNASFLDFDILSFCTSVKQLHVTWYFDEAQHANMPSDSEWMLKESVERLIDTTQDHQLEHVHIKTLGTMYPVWDARSRTVCSWIATCHALKSLVAELDFMGTWQLEKAEGQRTKGAARRETSLLGFIEDIAYFGHMAINTFEWWSMSRGGLFRDRHDINDPAIRQLLQPVTTLRLLISDPYGHEALVGLLPLFPSLNTVRLLHNPRFQTLPESFINLFEPMSDLPSLKTIEIDMEATLDPDTCAFDSQSLFGGFSLFLLGYCEKLEAVRLLFDQASDPAIFQQVWRFLSSEPRRKRPKLLWEVHVLPQDEIAHRTYWSDRDSLWLSVQGDEITRSTKGAAEGALVDKVVELEV